MKGIGCDLDGAALKFACTAGACLEGACLKGACLGGAALEGAELPPRAGKLANPPEEDWDLGGDGLEGAVFLIGDCSLVLVGCAFLAGEAPLDEPRDLLALRFLCGD